MIRPRVFWVNDVVIPAKRESKTVAPHHWRSLIPARAGMTLGRGLLDFLRRLREREAMSGQSCLCRIIIIRR